MAISASGLWEKVRSLAAVGAPEALFRDETVEGDLHIWDDIGIPLIFDGTTFTGRVSFEGTKFSGVVSFGDCWFEQSASFSDATFERRVSFEGATFEQGIECTRSRFEGDLILDGVDSEAAISLESCELVAPLDISIERCARLALDRATTSRYLTIAIEQASLITCRRTRFNEGVHITLASGDLVLEEAYFGRSSVVEGSGETRLVSMRAADVERLSLAAISLEDCRFHSVHNLDHLRLEGGTPFAHAPLWWPQQPTWPLPHERPKWLWGRERRREVLSEEVEWRVRKRDRRWDDISEPRDLPVGTTAPSARQIAPLYRALRKGREDAKNYPGAGDFYYGEMEMRREAAEKNRAERWLLSAYWLVGYGVRPLRSFIAFMLVVLAFTLPIISTGPHTLVADREAAWLPDRCNTIDDVRRVAACVPKPLTYALNPLSPQARGRDEPDLPDGLGLLGVPYRLITIALFGLTLIGLRARVQR